MTALATAFSVTFATVFLKGFQFKNVQNDRYKMVALTSCCIALCDVAVVMFVVQRGWLMAVPCALGAAIGMVSSMKVHDRVFKK